MNIEKTHTDANEAFNKAKKYATAHKLKKTLNIFGDTFLLSIFLGLLVSGFMSIVLKQFIYVPTIIFCILIVSIVYRIIFYKIFTAIDFGKKYSILLDGSNAIHWNIYSKLDQTGSIDQILEQLESLQKMIEKLRIYKIIWKYTISNTGILLMNRYIELEILFVTEVIDDLRSDLRIRISEQQQILKSAKSEVKENIGGTKELKDVSELQRIRLDTQLKQFKELQKILSRP